MSSTTLKPPPPYVSNEWAWAYTLNKLADRDGLDDGGNPRSYGAAVAIYKRVAAKYGNPDADAAAHKPGMAPITRADLIDLERRHWVVARGFAYTTTDTQAIRAFADSDGDWFIERIDDDGSAWTDRLGWETVAWLFGHHAGVLAWALEQGQ